MAFVNERISEEDKKKYGFDYSKTFWAIDRESNAFLILCGGLPTFNERNDMVQFYELYFNGNVSYIQTYYTMATIEEIKEGKKTRYDVIFNIDLLQIPQSLKNDLQKVKSLISDAFKVAGFFFNSEKVGNIEVNFPTAQRLGGGIYFIDPATFQKRKY